MITYCNIQIVEAHNTLFTMLFQGYIIVLQTLLVSGYILVIIIVCQHSCSQDITTSSTLLFIVSKGAKQSSTIPDPGYKWESDKLLVRHHNESQEVNPFPAGNHKAHINRRTQRHSKHKTEKKHKRSTKVYRLGTVSKIFYSRGT